MSGAALPIPRPIALIWIKVSPNVPDVKDA
jgi:hypothetical protein